MQVAVDGPASGGKSTISKILARKHGLTYLDTGAMYRAAALIAINHNLHDLTALADLLSETAFIFTENGARLTVKYRFDEKTYCKDITEDIRTPEVTARVSLVSANPEVRRTLTEKQREIASSGNIILDGRDIGTVVLPKAGVKFFLTATPEERAKRRTLEWEKAGKAVNMAHVLEDILKRDEQDSKRAAAPLRQAEDAALIDTTGLTIEEVAEKMSRIITMHVVLK